MTTGNVAMTFALWAGMLLGFTGLAVKRRRTVLRAGRQFDEIQATVDGWQRDYRASLEEVEQTVEIIERAVSQSEDTARVAAVRMRELRNEAIRRIETSEPQEEIELLVTQGRIPFEHSRRSW